MNNHVVTFQNTQYTLSTTEYLTSFDTTSAIPSGGKVVFTFPDYRIWKSGTGSIVVTYGSSYSSTYSSPTITWDSTSTYLTQISLNSFWTSGCAIGSYQFKFSSGIKNPDYVQPLTGNFVAYTTDSSGAIVNRDIKSNADVSPILPTPMTATITRSVSTLSTATVLTVSFTTVNPFPSGGKILLYMPTDQIKLTGSSVTCTKSDGTTSLTCSLTTSGSYYIVTINEWWTSGSGTWAAATSMSFMISGVVNPSLLSANVASTSWQVLTATSLSYSIDGKYTSLKPSPDLQGVAVTFTVASVANPVVYAQTTLNVGFTPNSNLPSNAIIEIGIPSGFALSPTTQSWLQLSPSSATLTCSYTTTSGYLTAISISDPWSHSNWLSTTPMVYQLSIQIRQNTMDVGGNFYVTTKTSSADIGIGSYANSITISPNPFVSYSLDNSGWNTVKASWSLSVKFTTVYTFPNKSNGGKISLTIPSDLTVVSTSWTATIGSSSMECSLASSVVTATHSLTTSVAGMQVIITFPTITNPSSTKPTSTFVFYSQESTSGTYYNIDGITSGLTYSVSTLGALSSVTVTRDTLDASNTGLKTGSATNFLFSFIITNDVASDGTFTIILPTESDAKLISTSTDYQCSATDWTTGSSISWTVTSSTRTILMTNYWSSASGRSWTGGSTIKICLKKNFMQNMGWIKSPLASTDSFAIKSGLSGGVYFTDGVTSSIVATPSLIPNLITFSSSPQISRTSNTVDVKVDWTFSITFSANSLTSTDYAYLTLPSDVVYDMGETLTTVLTSNSSLEVGNSKTLYSTGAINIIKLTSIWGSTGWAKSSQLSFKISWFKYLFKSLYIISVSVLIWDIYLL